MIGYKAFDSNFMCREFQYEVGKTYEFDGKIVLCDAGFHFCENIADCFTYYSDKDTRFARVEALGTVLKSDYNSKCVTDKIRIIEEIPLDEAIKMSNIGNFNTGNCNTGNRNAGNWSTGNCNTGNCNAGNCNSGNCNIGNWNSGVSNIGDSNIGDMNTGDRNIGNSNTGSWNTGSWNTGDRNTGNLNTGDWNKSSSNNGCFMTVKPTIMMFNKPSDWTIDDWRHSPAYRIMEDCPIDHTDNIWVIYYNMTDEERAEHPEYEKMGGYLKVVEHKADKQKWWDGLPNHYKQEVMDLPNFNPDIFYECTGIKV